MVSFAAQRLLSLIRSHWFICILLSFSRRWIKQDVALIYVKWGSSMFSSRNFIVSGLMFRFLNHFEFVLVYGVRQCSNFILLPAVVQFSKHHLLERQSFLHYICSYLLCHRLIDHRVFGFIYGLYLLFHCTIFLFSCQYHNIFIIVAL